MIVENVTPHSPKGCIYHVQVIYDPDVTIDSKSVYARLPGSNNLLRFVLLFNRIMNVVLEKKKKRS